MNLASFDSSSFLKMIMYKTKKNHFEDLKHSVLLNEIMRWLSKKEKYTAFNIISICSIFNYVVILTLSSTEYSAEFYQMKSVMAAMK